MTKPVPRDRKLLSQAATALAEGIERWGLQPGVDTHLRLLEGAAAHIGGYALDGFDLAVGQAAVPHLLDPHVAKAVSRGVAEAIQDSLLSPPLAVAVLGDLDLDTISRKTQGRYFTDSRLAQRLAGGVRHQATNADSILDPACGAGVLLVAAALEASATEGQRAYLVRRVLWGVDRNPLAVRATRAALASLAGDLEAIASLCRRLIVTDSLAAGRSWWKSRSPLGFDVVIANPPWEKLRITRHEHALGNGHERHYGDAYRATEIDELALHSERHRNSGYRKRVTAELNYQGTGESDLYKMFLELGASLTSSSGTLAFLIPAGFIRNRGTRELRDWLFRGFDIDILILDNRRRYFAIDSRFKFIQLFAKRRGSKETTIRFGAAVGTTETSQSSVETNLQELRDLQTDLALPEVKDRRDWEIFVKVSRRHPWFGAHNSGWNPRFYREVDMTKDRPCFKNVSSSSSDLPVIEGRMVHQHRVAAKQYLEGRGRRARWRAQLLSEASLRPQWFIKRSDIRSGASARAALRRAGFCDITGQTNERTVLAALIPAGVICGNKVPTLDFESEMQAQAWVGMANGFVFDWLARRLVTTTLNFFILRGIPIPAWNREADDFRAIAQSAEALSRQEGLDTPGDLWAVGRMRARIEVLSARLYGITVADLDHMLNDFPQVDGVQPPLPGETASTVTRDLIVALGSEWASHRQIRRAADRVSLAKSVGAVPFLPNEHARAYRRAS